VAVGRKNWLFCGSDKGGRIAAMPINHLATLLPDRWQATASK